MLAAAGLNDDALLRTPFFTPCELALVIPFVSDEVRTLSQQVQRTWDREERFPCATASPGGSSVFGRAFGRPLLVLYYKYASTISQRRLWHSIVTNSTAFSTCFSGPLILDAGLSEESHPYTPGRAGPKMLGFGPNQMFFDLILRKPAALATRKVDYIFWFEIDVVPIRRGWLDALQAEVLGKCGAGEDFWVKGSLHHGALSPSDVRSWSWNQMMFISACAIYRFGSPAFERFLHRMLSHFPMIQAEEARRRGLTLPGRRDFSDLRVADSIYALGASPTDQNGRPVRLGLMQCFDCMIRWFLFYGALQEQHKHLMHKYLYTSVIYWHGFSSTNETLTAFRTNAHSAFLAHKPPGRLDAWLIR